LGTIERGTIERKAISECYLEKSEVYGMYNKRLPNFFSMQSNIAGSQNPAFQSKPRLILLGLLLTALISAVLSWEVYRYNATRLVYQTAAFSLKYPRTWEAYHSGDESVTYLSPILSAQKNQELIITKNLAEGMACSRDDNSPSARSTTLLNGKKILKQTIIRNDAPSYVILQASHDPLHPADEQYCFQYVLSPANTEIGEVQSVINSLVFDNLIGANQATK